MARIIILPVLLAGCEEEIYNTEIVNSDSVRLDKKSRNGNWRDNNGVSEKSNKPQIIFAQQINIK